MSAFFHLISWCSPGEERAVERKLEIMMGVETVWRKVCISPGSKASMEHISAIATIVGMKMYFSKFAWDCGMKYLVYEKYLAECGSFSCHHVTWNSISHLKQPQKAKGTSPTPVLSIQSFFVFCELQAPADKVFIPSKLSACGKARQEIQTTDLFQHTTVLHKTCLSQNRYR